MGWAVWLYALGAVLAAALGPSPWWLAAEMETEDRRPLPLPQAWGLWAAGVALWPVAAVALVRRRLYPHP